MTRLYTFVAAAAALLPASLMAQQLDWIPVPQANGESRLDGQAGPIFGKPFTATEVRHSTQVLADGTKVERNDTSTFARDGHGRMRTANDKTILIFDPVAGFNYGLNLQPKTYEKAALPTKLNAVAIAVAGGRSSTSTSSGDGRAMTPGLPKNAVTEELSPQMINGVQARGSRITMTIPAGTFGNDRDIKVVNERWYSDDLQVLLKSTNNDPRFGVSTYELTNIVRTEPDPATFLVPSDYRLKSADAR
jgi:hypothetical protein